MTGYNPKVLMVTDLNAYNFEELVNETLLNLQNNPDALKILDIKYGLTTKDNSPFYTAMIVYEESYYAK